MNFLILSRHIAAELKLENEVFPRIVPPVVPPPLIGLENIILDQSGNFPNEKGRLSGEDKRPWIDIWWSWRELNPRPKTFFLIDLHV